MPSSRATLLRSSLLFRVLITLILASALGLVTAGWAAARNSHRAVALVPPPGDTTTVWGPDSLKTPNGNTTNLVEQLGVTPVPGRQYLLRLVRLTPSISKADVFLN